MSDRYTRPKPEVGIKLVEWHEKAGKAVEFLARKLDRFAKNVGGREALSRPEALMQIFENLTYEDFTSLLTSLNGIAIGKKERKKNKAMLGERFHRMFGDEWGHEGDLTPPLIPERERLMHEIFDTLQDLIRSRHPEAAQIVARTLCNAIYYLHPFPDGNQRTGRLAYFLFSPHIEKSPEKILTSMENVLMSEGETRGEYYQELDARIFASLLKKREIPFVYTGKEHILPFLDMRRTSKGFFDSHLRFLLAWDACTPEERKEYAHTIADTDVPYFKNDDLSREIQWHTYFDSSRKAPLPIFALNLPKQ